MESGQVGALLRRARYREQLSQRQLAAAARVPQSLVSAVERGRRSVRMDTLERLFEAAGVRLVLRGEPLWASVDAELDACAAVPRDERLARANLDARLVVDLLDGRLTYVVTGGAAGVVHGVPMAVEQWEVAVREDDVDDPRVARLLTRLRARLVSAT